MTEPVLAVFEQEGNAGTFNVWRYDGGTKCVEFGLKAKNSEVAKRIAYNHIQYPDMMLDEDGNRSIFDDVDA